VVRLHPLIASFFVRRSLPHPRRPTLIATAIALAPLGCNAILGNDERHPLSADGGTVEDGTNGLLPDSAIDGDMANGGQAAPDATQNEGGAVPPTTGGIFTVSRVPSDADATPDAGTVTVTDDGFEFGERLCGGAICVTGAMTP